MQLAELATYCFVIGHMIDYSVADKRGNICVPRGEDVLFIGDELSILGVKFVMSLSAFLACMLLELVDNAGDSVVSVGVIIFSSC